MAAGVAISHANNNRIASNHSRLRDFLCPSWGLFFKPKHRFAHPTNRLRGDLAVGSTFGEASQRL